MILVAKSETDPRWLGRHRKVSVSRPLAIAKMSAADQAEVTRLLSNQARVTSQVRTAFLQAIGRLQQQVDVERIRALLEAGRVDEAISVVNAALVQQGLAPIAASITAAVVVAGHSAAQTDALGQLNVTFGFTNPETINYLRNYEFNLIRGLSQDALDSVRTVITNGIAAGRNPLDIARDVRQFIGLTDRQTQAVLNYRAMLEGLDSGALDRALRDARFDSTVANAVDSGTELSQEYIDKLVDRYTQRYLKYRSETIARTEAIRAVNTGNDKLWRQAVADGKVEADTITRKWIYTHDAKTRPAHRAIPGMNPDGVGLDEPFDTPDGPLMYPGDPAGPPEATINCRCTVVLRYTPKRAAEQ